VELADVGGEGEFWWLTAGWGISDVVKCEGL